MQYDVPLAWRGENEVSPTPLVGNLMKPQKNIHVTTDLWFRRRHCNKIVAFCQANDIELLQVLPKLSHGVTFVGSLPAMAVICTAVHTISKVHRPR